MTMMGSFGGGCFGLVFTMIKNKGRADVMELINSILGALVSITGVVAVGLFADNPIPMDTTNGRAGLFKGGGWYLLGVQTLTAICLMAWGLLVTMALLWLIDKVLPIRMDPYEELLGADLCEHRIRHGQVGVSRAVSALRPYHRSNSIEEVGGIGVNTGHSLVVDKLFEAHLNKGKNKGKLQTFNNQAFTNEPRKSFQNNGFLNKRPGNPENDLHRTIDSMANEIDGTNFENRSAKVRVFPENVRAFSGSVRTFSGNVRVIPERVESTKGKKFRELSVVELEELGEMNANEDRFRHRFGDEDYVNDIERSGLKWTD